MFPLNWVHARMIWLALAEQGAETTTRKLAGDFGRTMNRERASTAALEMLRKRLS